MATEALTRLRHELVKRPVGQWLLRGWLTLSYPESGRALYLARSIEGWLSDPEGAQLFKIAKHSTPDANPVVVEIGSWKGKSSSIIAAGLGGKREARLFSIDPFGLDENPEYQKLYYDNLMKPGEDVLEVFRRNIDECGMSHIVKPLRGYSFDIVTTWDAPIDFLFIDGNHEYEAVARDFALWSRFVRVGGIVALHDAFCQWPGPTRVVREQFVKPCYGDVKRVDTLAWACKLQDSVAVAPQAARSPT
jgi:predicted O-methyltransferase YrrM